MKDHIEHEVENKVKKYVTVAFKIFFGIIAAILFALLFGYVIMWLWNWLMPTLFGLTVITYWQAVGILVLSKLLFGGLGNGPSGRSGRKSKKHFKGKLRRRCNGNGFSKWKLYDKFWEEEGEKAYQAYVERSEKENNDIRHE